MIYAFLPEAKSEFLEAVQYYENGRAGLGSAFAKEITRLILEVCEHPHRWPTLSSNTRRHRSKRFPYSVIYQVFPENILIVAIAPAARKPGYWRKRSC
jgi:hypothetical protein